MCFPFLPILHYNLPLRYLYHTVCHGPCSSDSQIHVCNAPARPIIIQIALICPYMTSGSEAPNVDHLNVTPTRDEHSQRTAWFAALINLDVSAVRTYGASPLLISRTNMY